MAGLGSITGLKPCSPRIIGIGIILLQQAVSIAPADSLPVVFGSGRHLAEKIILAGGQGNDCQIPGSGDMAGGIIAIGDDKIGIYRPQFFCPPVHQGDKDLHCPAYVHMLKAACPAADKDCRSIGGIIAGGEDESMDQFGNRKAVAGF